MVLRLLFLATALAGCRQAPPSSGAVSLTDDGGAVVRLAGPATRVVSLIPAATEILFALGAGPSLVGRTRWCDYPAAAARVESVGDGIGPNVELVAARLPDLVVMYRSGANDGAVARLRSLGIPVLVLALDRLADFDRSVNLLAAAIGRPAVGDSLIAATHADLEAATVAGGPRPRLLVLAWSDPPIAIGRGSFLSEILDRAGADNIFADVDRASFPVSIEAVAERNPEAVLVVGDEDPPIADRSEWRAVRAVADRRFVHVNGSEFNRPSPRIGAAVRGLATALARFR
ncbi:MAG: ABC transporter substrate-binding protein [Gemmatimonadales bacterium]